MKTLPSVKSIRTTKGYEDLVKALYAGVKQQVEEIEMPPLRVIGVTGKEPPAAKPYQEALAVLYGIGYSLKMGLKSGTLRQPAGYFDYRVGALETFWWSVGKEFEMATPTTLRWHAYFMVPAFVTEVLVDEARRLARTKRAHLPYDTAALTTVDEGRSVQALHVGRYDSEQPTIDQLHAYASEHDLTVTGKHHEIYLSDPRRTQPEKLKTVIRFGVTAASERRRT